MEFFDKFYFNFFSVGSLIPFFYYLLIGLFFVTIPNRSKASFYIGIAFLGGMTVLGLVYFFASSYYSPFAAYHRYFTVGGTLFGILCLNQFFLNFPSPIHQKATRNLAIIQGILSLVILIFFIIQTAKSKIIYNFTGFYYDFDAESANKISGLFILIDTFVMIGIGIYRTVVTKTWERWAVFAIMISFFILVGSSAISNTLSREGALERSTYHTIWDITSVIGGFIVVVTYINTTKDKTSFMVKIIGISIVTLLLAFLSISYYGLQDREDYYSKSHADLSRMLYGERSWSHESLEYSIFFNPISNEFKKKISEEEFGETDESLKFELLNTRVFEKLKEKENHENNLEEILNDSHPFFGGYANYIKNKAIDASNNKNPRSRIIESVKNLSSYLNYRRLKIKKMEDTNFRNLITKFLDSQKGDFEPFKKAMISHLQASKSEGAYLKSEILQYILPMNEEGTRIYRGNPYSEKHFVSFIVYDKEKDSLAEFGYSTKAYRSFISVTGKKMVVILTLFVLFITIGFRFFFLGALINPLDSLLAGVKKVNEGDLGVVVPVKVEDEIGFLSRSFNSMVSSIREGKEKLEDYAETLEIKVEERTQELKNTLDEVQALKQQQDGDYFLTSLLLKPLSTNKAKSENIHLEFFTKQKKNFIFRNWQEEIGGDISAAQNISLKGKNYIAFVNADAMGKSMQGAGGALVLGAVFESIIERTRITSAAQDNYPERWIKNTFIELHKIFESFNGSMLISLVLGLVDDETGLMYYINAEHPWTVLYRDKKAAFIENELLFRKLGTHGMDGEIYIRTFQLEPQDVIYIGSDGRDDLLLETDGQGERVINENETLFLRNIERADGDLKGVVEEIKKVGQVTDDLSLIRLSYKEKEIHPDEAEARSYVAHEILDKVKTIEDQESVILELKKALELDNHQPEILKAIIKAYIDMKDYKNAILYVEDYLFLQPGDNEILFVASYCYRKIGLQSKAIDYGERVKLREPGKVKNLVHLAETYSVLKQYNRAEKILESALAKEPENVRGLKLRDILKEKKSV
ncbi:MAG: SpoIIE family protein phosphatase [Leptospiraceae bacterium]|nr:SpoIIE family protein phosphatase [Leptospiraceae bacterium]